MSSLTTCLKRAGDLLGAEHRTAIVSRAKVLRETGMNRSDAAKQAVAERIQAVEEMLRNAPEPVAKAKVAEKPIDAPQARELSPVEAQKLTPSKREEELGRLLNEATDEKVRADLTKQIEAERKDRVERARGEEYLRLADGTTDPELRTQLEAKAAELGVRRRLPEPEVVEIPVEPQVVEAVEVDMAAWRREHALSADDAQRAEKVADAFLIDPERVTFFALQYDAQPRAFDRAIQSILDDGERDASTSKGAAESSQRPEPETRQVQREEGGRQRDQQGSEQRQEARPAVPESAGETEDVGRTFATRANAAKVRRELGNGYRVQKVGDRFTLRKATDKELAAADRAGRRLSRGTSVNPETDSLLTAIAKLGGISMRERPDTISSGNRNIAGRMLFRNDGSELDTLASEALTEFGYVPSDEMANGGGVPRLREAIRAEFEGRRTYYSEQGTDWMQEIQRRQEMAQDFYDDLPPGELARSGYNDEPPTVTDVIDLEVTEVPDIQALREEAARLTEGENQDAYESRLDSLINAELARIGEGGTEPGTAAAGDEDRSGTAAQEGAGRAEAGEPEYSLQRAPGLRAGRADPGADGDAQNDRARQAVDQDVQSDLRAIESAQPRSGFSLRLGVVEPDDVSAGLPRALAEAFNAPIFFVRAIRGRPNFNAATINGRIYIHADGDAPAVALVMHEVGHNLPADIKADLVRDVMATVSAEQRDRFLREFPGYGNKPDAVVNEELTMRIIEQDAQNPAFWDSLARRMGDTKFGQLAKSILDTIDRIISGFAKQDSSEFTSDIRKVRKAVGDALMLAQARQELGGSDLQFADKRTDASPLGFYSQLTRAAEAGPGKGTAQAWKDYFKGQQSKGVRADEIGWSGVGDWLDLQPGSVTKDQVTDYLRNNGVKVDETVLGGPLGADLPAGWSVNQVDEEPNLWQVYDEMGGVHGEGETREEALESARDESESGVGGVGTKYASYTVPGGKNYREVLLTLPAKPARISYGEPALFNGDGRMRNHTGEILTGVKGTEVFVNGEKVGSITHMPASDGDVFLVYTKHVQNAYFDSMAEAKAAIEQDARTGYAAKHRKDLYNSGHWDQPNILAHVRVDDRTDADGNKVLFVNEIQSDWGQQGKKRGFRNQGNPATAAFEAFEKDITDRFRAQVRAEVSNELKPDRLDSWVDNIVRNSKTGDMARALGEQDRATELFRAMLDEETASNKALPRAPFVGKTDAWVALAIKRLTKMAVDGGYDKVAFISGDQAADLYDLSKQVETIWYRKSGDNNYKVEARVIGGSPLNIPPTLDASGIEDYVGKEMAKKIVETATSERQSISGDGLKVGGEGMKAFYDKIVPNVAKDVLRKVGGKPTEVRIDTAPKFDGTPDDLMVRINETSTGQFRVGVGSGDERVAATLPTRKAAEDWAKEQQDIARRRKVSSQIGFEITPEIRAALADGLPLFSERRPAPTTGRKTLPFLAPTK